MGGSNLKVHCTKKRNKGKWKNRKLKNVNKGKSSRNLNSPPFIIDVDNIVDREEPCLDDVENVPPFIDDLENVSTKEESTKTFEPNYDVSLFELCGEWETVTTRVILNISNNAPRV